MNVFLPAISMLRGRMKHVVLSSSSFTRKVPAGDSSNVYPGSMILYAFQGDVICSRSGTTTMSTKKLGVGLIISVEEIKEDDAKIVLGISTPAGVVRTTLLKDFVLVVFL